MSTDKQKPELVSSIDENLKRAYTELANEELPERFRLLLQELKEKENGAPEGDNA